MKLYFSQNYCSIKKNMLYDEKHTSVLPHPRFCLLGDVAEIDRRLAFHGLSHYDDQDDA